MFLDTEDAGTTAPGEINSGGTWCIVGVGSDEREREREGALIH